MTDERRLRGLAGFARYYVLPLWRWYLGGTLFLALTNVIVLVLPALARDVVNAFSSAGKDAVASLPLVVIALGVLLVVVRVLSRIFFFWPGRRIEAEARHDIFDRILRASRRSLSRYGQGDLVSRIANDTGYLRVFFAFGMLALVNVIFLLTMTIVAMSALDATLTALALVPFVPLFVATRYLLPAMHRASLRQQEAVGALSSAMSETFRGLSSVRLHAATPAFSRRIAAENEKVFTSSRRLALLETTVFPLAGFMVNVSQAIVLAYGGAEVIAGRLSAGDIMVFNVYMTSLAFPLAFSGALLAILERSRSAHGRIAEILALPAQGASGIVAAAGNSAEPGGATREDGGGNPPLLEVRALSHSFTKEADAFTFADVTFSVDTGRRIGVTGPVGCGKSLLFDLILRFEEPEPGRIFFAGRDVREWEPALLRSEICCALQTARLLSDTIRGNLRFGLARPVDDDELMAALERACLADEIRSLPDGLGTVTGEKGLRLSGGQRQRLALARIFLRRPRLVLLDDVLSAVDQKTERHLVANLFAGETPVVVSSHRTSVLEACDEVLLFAEGRIADRGRYAELAARHRRFFSDHAGHGEARDAD